MNGRSLLLAAAVTGLAVSVAGCGGSSEPAATKSSAATFTVHGTVGLIGSVDSGYGSGCFGTNGYDDLEAGAQVTITDAGGKTIGLGQLGRGHHIVTANCAWDFTVAGIPDTEGASGIYGVTVSHRGTVSFKRSGAANVSLSIGN